jgi:ribonucleotide monophosphatase NagD (HAD superfamily)
LAKIRHIAFDLDGMLYRGHSLFDYTKATLDTLDSLGIGYTFLTNNSRGFSTQSGL